jgi:hypothetical protein
MIEAGVVTPLQGKPLILERVLSVVLTERKVGISDRFGL